MPIRQSFDMVITSLVDEWCFGPVPGPNSRSVSGTTEYPRGNLPVRCHGSITADSRFGKIGFSPENGTGEGDGGVGKELWVGGGAGPQSRSDGRRRQRAPEGAFRKESAEARGRT